MTFRLYPALLAMLSISLFFSFSCTTDINLPPPPGSYISSSDGVVFCEYGTTCSAMASEICSSIGGHQVASCPGVSSSSSTTSTQSSSSKISSSSSRASSSSSGSQSDIVWCQLPNGTCSQYAQELCNIVGGAVVSSCNSTRSVTIEVSNAYGEGWGYNLLRVNVNGIEDKYVTLDDGYSDYYTFNFTVGDVIRVYWIGDSDSYPEDCAFNIHYIDSSASLLIRSYGTLHATDETLIGSFVVTAP